MNYSEANNFFEVNMIKDFNSEKMKWITEKEAKFIDRIIQSRSSLGLDVMCGYGRIANKLHELGYTNLEGVDIGNFDFISEKKKIPFYNQDVYSWVPDKKYDFCYSLYNSYINLEQVKTTINKCCSFIKNDGIAIIDVFNKEWRDSIDVDSHRIVHEDDLISVELDRHYDGLCETSVYSILDKNNLTTKEFSFSQCFLTRDELISLIPEGCYYDITDSATEQTRENNQKNILILKKGVR